MIAIFLFILIFRFQSTNFICNTGKEVFREKKDLNSSSKSGNSAVMLKIEKAFDSYKFILWLDDFIQSCQGRSNLLQIHLPCSIDSLNQFPDNESYERREETPESENGDQDFGKSEENKCRKSVWTTENIN